MKRTVILLSALIPALSAFAYYGDYDYFGNGGKMSGFAIFTLVVMIVYIILSIVILVRWWKMTKNVDQIKKHIVQPEPTLTYLVAIGENEKAQKAALKLLVDTLYPVYIDIYVNNKAAIMNKLIASRLPRIEKLGLSVPDYVTSGEKFIDYMNSLTFEDVRS